MQKLIYANFKLFKVSPLLNRANSNLFNDTSLVTKQWIFLKLWWKLSHIFLLFLCFSAALITISQIDKKMYWFLHINSSFVLRMPPPYNSTCLCSKEWDIIPVWQARVMRSSLFLSLSWWRVGSSWGVSLDLEGGGSGNHKPHGVILLGIIGI